MDYEKSIQFLKPELVREWDYEKNKELRPDAVACCSNKEAWWKCEKGHSWHTKIYVRTKQECGCPYCAGKKPIIGETDFATLFPDLAKQWDYEKNGNKLPRDFTKKSGYNAFWKCEKGHTWQTSIHGRASMHNGCPYCSGHYAIKGVNDLESQFPNVAKEWDYDRNKKKPSEVRDFSNGYAYWKCKYGHTWRAQVLKRTKRNQSCPYCSGRYAIPGENDILTKNPGIMYLWDYEKNNAKGIYPQNCKGGSDKYANWKCEYGHSWRAQIKHIVRGERCPICNGTVLKEGVNDIATVAPELICEMHPSKNGNLLPSMIPAHSGKKIWWQCVRGHEWKATPDKRVSGRNCPECSKG